MTPQRPRKKVSQRRTILIACEGKSTEPIYFDGLRQEQSIRDRFVVKVVPGTGGDARTTVNNAIEESNRAKIRREPYDEVWCVVDVETIASKAQFSEAQALMKEKAFISAASNPSFEVWLIAHFECIQRHFQDSKAVEERLQNDHWKPNFRCDYDKSDQCIYGRLEERVDQAILNAKWVLETHHKNSECKDSNSSTEVYLLANRLRSSV